MCVYIGEEDGMTVRVKDQRGRDTLRIADHDHEHDEGRTKSQGCGMHGEMRDM